MLRLSQTVELKIAIGTYVVAGLKKIDGGYE